ncbi:MAG: bifunctional diguanylate cyclase/phosphodiesterase [Gallionellaceae bacterium]|nr:bifunctional diguanylate cyclase/phosphodiesterase [Gallionellaceae bacterium]
MGIHAPTTTLTTIDQTTGFLNRTGGVELIEQLSSSKEDPTLSLIWIGLNRLKHINESLGHNAGDTVIAHITLRLRTKSGQAKWCRIGGDEFVCIIPGKDANSIRQLAAAFLREVQLPIPYGDLLLHPSASIGIASKEAGEGPYSLLARADSAFNSAKRTGSGQIVVAGEEPAPKIHLGRRELEIESKLHSALEYGGLNLHYQPIVDQDGKIIAVEALMRCMVNGENISPGELIPVAEKTGLIYRLGDWCLTSGAKLAQRLSAAGSSIKVAINVSRSQLSLPHFSSSLHAALLISGAMIDQVELELTESLFLDSSKIVQDNLLALRKTGISLAIDDFGTGYSCLANLKDIRATKIKLDKSFVSALPDDHRSLAVIKALAQLGSELGMTVVAEGIESRKQYSALRYTGIHAFQGYYVAPPIPEEGLLQWLTQRT